MSPATLAAAALAAAALGGCETTQQLSAKLGRGLGRQSAIAGTTTLGGASRAVHVRRSAVLAGSPGAVALELTNTSARAQSAIPVLIDVTDARGASVYRNDTSGLDPSLQQLAALPGHATAWWVDNEVLPQGGVPHAVSARIGAGGGSARAVTARIVASGVSASSSFPGPHVDATLRNDSNGAVRMIAVYVVALAHGRVVGAGRAAVATLRAGSRAQVEVPMTGTVSKTAIAVTVAAAG
jgi:hypothetical protein